VGQLRNFPAISLYSNWCLHPSLTINTVSQEILATIITNLPTANDRDPSFIDLINGNLRHENLRDEIIRLSNDGNSFRNVFNNNARWNSMYGVILNLVTDKPLSPPINLSANSRLRVTSTNTSTIQLNSTIRLWIHGERGRQAEWTIAIVPDGITFDMNNLTGLQTFSGGVFTRG
jgi:hypothetical protein